MELEQRRYDVEQPIEEGEGQSESTPERSNVIEGPWPKPDAQPVGELPAEERVEPDLEQVEKLAKVRADIDAAYNSQAEAAGETNPAESPEPEDESEKEYLPYTESYTEFKRCEKCGGKGRRWLVLRCPVCGGMGSVPAKSTSHMGYYVREKAADPDEPEQETAEPNQ